MNVLLGNKCHPFENVGEVDHDGKSGKGLVFDDTIQLSPYATVTVYRCQEENCLKPCVTLRAYKMHAKCVHKSTDLAPLVMEVKANFICKVDDINLAEIILVRSCFFIRLEAVENCLLKSSNLTSISNITSITLRERGNTGAISAARLSIRKTCSNVMSSASTSK